MLYAADYVCMCMWSYSLLLTRCSGLRRRLPLLPGGVQALGSAQEGAGALWQGVCMGGWDGGECTVQGVLSVGVSNSPARTAPPVPLCLEFPKQAIVPDEAATPS